MSALFFVDLVSKTVAVELWPDALLFNVSDRMPFGLAAGLVHRGVRARCSRACCRSGSSRSAPGLALGGSLGNLGSRHWWGELGGTPDFIRFADGSTGNLADLSIAAGAMFMVLSIDRLARLDGVRAPRSA